MRRHRRGARHAPDADRPATEDRPGGTGLTVVKATQTARQTRLLARLAGPLLDPHWEVTERLRTGCARPAPSRPRSASPTAPGGRGSPPPPSGAPRMRAPPRPTSAPPPPPPAPPTPPPPPHRP